MDKELKTDTLVRERYKIVRTLGHGGQCFVYEVDDLKENKKVVLKEMRSKTSDAAAYGEDVVMFKKEYEILERLNHPGLPKGYSYFQEGEKHFIVVQYINGKNLEVLLQEHGMPFDEKQVVKWGIDLAELLVYLYSIKPYPVVVRDIKPSNIVISDAGRATLVDFTVAREYKCQQIGDTVRIGSPGYAPPEQYKGLSDYRSDIYALGVTLHRLLTNADPSKMPFQFSPIRHYDPSFHRKLEYVISKAIELDPKERYQKPEELLKYLKYVMDELSGIEHMEFDISPIIPPSGTYTEEGESLQGKSKIYVNITIYIVVLVIILLFALYELFLK